MRTLIICLFICIVSACASGPMVTLCIVDYKNSGFQCNNVKNEKSFRTYAQGKDLECISPNDIEDALKACKNHQVLSVTLCSMSSGLDKFNCKYPDGTIVPLELSDADNYACLNDQDRKRILQRCMGPKYSLELEDENYSYQ